MNLFRQPLSFATAALLVISAMRFAIATEFAQLTFLPASNWQLMNYATVERTEGHDGNDCLHVHAELPSCTMKDWEGDATTLAASSQFLPVQPGVPYHLSVWAKGAANIWLHVWTYEGEEWSTFVHSTTSWDGADRFSVLEDDEWHLCVSPLLIFPERSNYAKVVLELVGNLPMTPYLDIRFSDVKFMRVPEHSAPDIHVVKAITDQLLSPSDSMLPEPPSDGLFFRATRGEYSAASFVVEGPAGNLENFLPQTNDLVSEEGEVIPASALALRHVALWFTGAPTVTPKQIGYRTLTPELLLNDPTLVKYSLEDRGNYLRLDFPERSFYTYISATLEERHAIPGKEYFHLGIQEFPVRDRQELCPARIAFGERRQFWVTLHVPEEALPGIYHGVITFTNRGVPCAELPVTVEVLPFDLLPPENYISSIYYKGYLGPNGAIGAGNYPDSKNPEQYLAEMKNLIAHGVDNPPIFLWWRGNDIAFLNECLTLRELAGMSNRTLFLWGSNTGDSDKPEDLAQLRASVEKAIAIAHEHGAEEIYFYGIDEARPDVLAREQPAWQVVHEAGGKIYVAVMDLSDALNTSLDLAVVLSERFTDNDVAQARAKGMKLLSYGHPQSGCVTPETYRRNYGLLLWQWGFDGAMTHAYQCGYGFIWNDFDGLYRDENMAYPTADGVIDTIQWEGYREGVTDLRYLATLQQAIRQAPNTPAAIRAATFLAELKKADLDTRDLDEIRSQMIDLILALNAH